MGGGGVEGGGGADSLKFGISYKTTIFSIFVSYLIRYFLLLEPIFNELYSPPFL